MSAGDQAVGERFLASGVEERELVMIQTQLMKNGCVQIGNGDPICHDLVAKVIGDPMDMARFEAVDIDGKTIDRFEIQGGPPNWR